MKVKYSYLKVFSSLVAGLLLTAFTAKAADPVVTGELKKWHAISLTWDGATSFTETSTPNVFRDYRLNVTFTHPGTGKSYRVAGFWAADGNAENTSATSGNKWRVMFNADEAGTWNYVASFRTGTDVALGLSPTDGTATDFDGSSGSFDVGPTDKTGRDHRGMGRLRYVNKHHLQFGETGEYFLKSGADSPENLMNFVDFDDQPASSNRKTWSAHAGDYNTDGDEYLWKTSKGKNLMGALNYLSGKGMNVFSFLPFTVPGDDKNVAPHLFKVSTANPSWSTGVYHDRFDVSRMAQWGRIFSYADKKGLYLHFKMLENESQSTMDGGNLGPERKLYYRELIARYGHHLALNWNLGEEVNTATTAQKTAWAQYIYDVDPYHHLIVIHNMNVEHYDLIGTSKTTGMSLQKTGGNVFSSILEYRSRSDTAGTPWVVSLDESGGAQQGVPPDSVEPTHDSRRGTIIWSPILSGGGGQETYFGYAVADSGDLTNQNWRRYDLWWDQCRYALEFIKNNAVPFQDMVNRNSLLSGATSSGPFCFAKAGEVYVVYMAAPSTRTLNLSGTSGTFSVHWYDPFRGGVLQTGSVTQVTGGGTVSLGAPPNTSTKDWVALVKQGNPLPTVTVSATDAIAGEPSDNGTFTFTRTGSTSADMTVNFAVSGTATSVADYTAIGTAVTIPAGQASATVTVTVQDDLTSESSETVAVNLASGTGYNIGSPGSATVTIADNEPVLPVITVTATDANAAEPSDNGTFTFTRTGTTVSGMTVNYTVGGTATSGSDYTDIGTSVNFAIGQSSVTLTVAVIDDELAEPTETVIVNLANSAGYIVGSPSSATVSIVDNDTTVVSLHQGTDSNGLLVIEAENANATPIVENGQSWTPVTAPSGFSGSGAMQALPNTGVKITLATIGNSPSLNYPVTFTKTGTHYIWIRGNGATAGDNSVIIGLNGSAAANGDDVSVPAGTTHVWNNKTAGGVVRTINVPSVGLHVLNLWMREDGMVADKLLLTVNSAYTPTGTGPVESPTSGGGSLPSVSITASDASAGESADNGAFTLTRSGSTSGTLTVNFTVGGTATSGSDYTDIGTSVTIADGQASATVPVTVIDNITFENTETVLVTLASGTGYTVGSPSSATVNITDNDTASGGLPSPWVTADIGAVGAVGSATYSDPTFTIKGSGVDIISTADEFRYVSQSSSGDCTIVAKVLSIQNTNAWAKAGVMIRESTAANSPNIFVFVTPTNGVTITWRATAGGTTNNTTAAVAGQTAPKWLKITRVANVFTASRSDDGVTWTQVGAAQTINMATTATLGLAVTSHADGTLCTSTMDNVTATP